MAERALPGRDQLPGRDELPGRGARVHFVGVGGAGMRGLAVLMAGAGWRVSGCDREAPADPSDLEAAGVAVAAGHDPSHPRDAELVVHTSAVPAGHPELAAARTLGVPLLKRARALGALVNGTALVGVGGTHGKTTITAMTALALRAAGLEPAALVGGRVPGWGGFALPGPGIAPAGPDAREPGPGRLRGSGGAPAPVVVEADEFDRSFLDLDPHLAIVSSVEAEHLESYGSVAALEAAFHDFAERALPRLGVLACADDAGARRLAERLPGVRTYGEAEDADYRVESRPDGGGGGGRACRLRAPGAGVVFRLAVPGAHNQRNAAAAMATALLLGADPERLAGALAGFRGVERRLQPLADAGGVVVVDDYAHHPTEVRESLAAVREAYPGRRLEVVFQPHLYTRTLALAREFADALALADAAHVLPIYPAREEPIPGVTSALIAEAAPARVRLAGREAVGEVVRAAGERPTALVFMGAGDVTELAHRAARGLAADALGG